MGKRNVIGKGMKQNMERINRWANGRRQKPKVKRRGKGEDRRGKGEKGRYSKK
jgi:hypothetical protein